MPEMLQRSSNSHSEDRPESGATVLGLFGVSEVQDDKESLRDKARDNQEAHHQK